MMRTRIPFMAPAKVIRFIDVIIINPSIVCIINYELYIFFSLFWINIEWLIWLSLHLLILITVQNLICCYFILALLVSLFILSWVDVVRELLDQRVLYVIDVFFFLAFLVIWFYHTNPVNSIICNDGSFLFVMHKERPILRNIGIAKLLKLSWLELLFSI